MVLDVRHSRPADGEGRVLYFDIEGTLVEPGFGGPKAALAFGTFERLVRQAGFDRLVCVSDAVSMARAIADAGGPPVHDTLFDQCRGTFEDAAWFRRVTDVTPNPLERGRFLPTGGDWYYVDDWAWTHVARAGRADLEASETRDRIFQCVTASGGREVVRWLCQRIPCRGGLLRGARSRAIRAHRRGPPRRAYGGAASCPAAAVYPVGSGTHREA